METKNLQTHHADQNRVFRIIGSVFSPYTMKVVMWFAHHQIPHKFEPRSAANQEEFKRRAKLPLVPLVITPADENLQDSTPILKEMFQRFPKSHNEPSDPSLAFLSALIEDFADEWGNKWVFHLRWRDEVDQIHTARRMAQVAAELPLDAEPSLELINSIKERMVSRRFFVGSNDITAPCIEYSYRDTLEILNAHFAKWPFLLGNKASLADFGLYGQLFCCSNDFTAGKMLEDLGRNIQKWMSRIETGPITTKEESWGEWQALAPTLYPLIREQIGELYLPWSVANKEALATQQKNFSVMLGDKQWEQQPQKYHAKALVELQRQYAVLPQDAWIHEILDEAGCKTHLTAENSDQSSPI